MEKLIQQFVPEFYRERVKKLQATLKRQEKKLKDLLKFENAKREALGEMQFGFHKEDLEDDIEHAKWEIDAVYGKKTDYINISPFDFKYINSDESDDFRLDITDQIKKKQRLLDQTLRDTEHLFDITEDENEKSIIEKKVKHLRWRLKKVDKLYEHNHFITSQFEGLSWKYLHDIDILDSPENDEEKIEARLRLIQRFLNINVFPRAQFTKTDTEQERENKIKQNNELKIKLFESIKPWIKYLLEMDNG